MKLRPEEKIETVQRPKRTIERFSKEEIEFMLTLHANDYKIKDITKMMIEKFGVKREEGTIYGKLKSISKNGIPKFKEAEIERTYAIPDTASQMLRQLEVAFQILSNAKQFLEKVKVWEVDYLDQVAKLRKVEGIFGEPKTN